MARTTVVPVKTETLSNENVKLRTNPYIEYNCPNGETYKIRFQDDDGTIEFVTEYDDVIIPMRPTDIPVLMSAIQSIIPADKK